MKIFSVIFCALLFSCSAKEISYRYPDNPDYARKSRAGNAFSKGDLVVHGKKKNGENSSKESAFEKSSLWQSSLEVVGALFPIAATNSESGIITTEWYQDSPSSLERIKINVFVKNAEVKKENLQITILRQKKSTKKNSAKIWEDANHESSDSGGHSAKILQEKILEQAQGK